MAHQPFGRRRRGVLVCVVTRPRWHRIACGLAPGIRGGRGRRTCHRNVEHEYSGTSLNGVHPTALGIPASSGNHPTRAGASPRRLGRSSASSPRVNYLCPAGNAPCWPPCVGRLDLKRPDTPFGRFRVELFITAAHHEFASDGSGPRYCRPPWCEDVGHIGRRKYRQVAG
jgi:hypothetical protein